MNDFNKQTNEYTSLQKYKSLILYFRKDDVLLCVRDDWRQGQTAILNQVLPSTIAMLLSHLALGCSTGGHWGTQSPQSASWFSLWHPASNWPTATGTLSIFFLNTHLLPLFFGLFTQVHLLIDGSVEGQYITVGHAADQVVSDELARVCKRRHPLAPGRRYGKKKKKYSLWVCVSPPISQLVTSLNLYYGYTTPYTSV